MCEQYPSEINYVGSSPTVGIFLYIAKALELMLVVDFGINYVGSSPTVVIFPYVDKAVGRVRAVVFVNKLRSFESHCRYSSIFSQGS